MKCFFSPIFLLLLSCRFCFSETSINEYEQRSFPRIDLDRTVTEFRNSSTFVALLSNAQLFACSYGKVIDTPKIPQEKKVKEIFSSDAAFTVLLDDGKILCFGDINLGGSTPILPPDRKVLSIIPSPYAFAAVLEDPVTFQQTIISWGDHYTERYYFNPKPSAQQFDEIIDLPLTTKVTSIVANDAAFTALYENGEIHSWGDQKFRDTASDFFQKKVLSLTSARWATIARLSNIISVKLKREG